MNRPIRGDAANAILAASIGTGSGGSRHIDLSLRHVDLTRLEHTLVTTLSPLVHERCDDWRLAVESSVAELLDGDHVVFGIPRARVPMDIHAMNVATEARRAIETLFGRLPDLPADPWLMEAERERLRGGVEVWSRFRAFRRPTGGVAAFVVPR